MNYTIFVRSKVCCHVPSGKVKRHSRGLPADDALPNAFRAAWSCDTFERHQRGVYKSLLHRPFSYPPIC